MKNECTNPLTTEVRPVSEHEFQAALAAYIDNINSDVPAECELEETMVLTNKYWGVGDKSNTEFVAKDMSDKESLWSKTKAYFKR